MSLGASRCLQSRGGQPTASCSTAPNVRPIIRPRLPKLRAVLPVRNGSAEWLSAELDIGGPDRRRARLAQSLQIHSDLPEGHPDGHISAAEHTAASSSNGSVPSSTSAASTSNGTAALTSTSPAAAAAAAAAVEADTATAAAAAASASGTACDEDDSGLHKEFQDCTCWEDVLDVLADELPNMSPRNTVTALGRLQKLSKGRSKADAASLLGSQAFLGLLARLAKQLASMTALQAVNALHSCATLGAPLGAIPALMSRFDDAFRRLAPTFNGRDVSSTLYAYALLRHRPSEDVVEAIARRAQVLVDGGQLNGQSVSMLLWGCATMGYKHGYLLTSCVAWLEGPGFAQLTTQGAANCAWALAKLGRATPAILSAALQTVDSAADACRPQEVANILWACVASRHHPLAGLNAVLQYAARNANRLSGGDVANIFHALGTFAHRPGAVVSKALAQRALVLLPGMRPHEAANVYWGLGLSGAVEDAPELFAAIAERKLVALASTSAAAPASSATSAAAAGAAASGSTSSNSTSSGNGPLLRQAFQGFLAAKLAGAKATLPKPLLDAMKAAWAEGLGDPTARKPMGVHAQLVATLRELGVKNEACTFSKDGLIPIDVLLKGGGGRAVALQVAGEHEYAANTRQLLGPALLARDIMEHASGFEVRFVAAREWLDTPAHARLQMTVELLRSCGVSVSAQAADRARARKEEGAARAAQQGGSKGRAGKDAGDDGAVVSGSEGRQRRQQQQWQDMQTDVKPHELDLLMGNGSGGAWQSGSGRGSRGRAASRKR